MRKLVAIAVMFAAGSAQADILVNWTGIAFQSFGGGPPTVLPNGSTYSLIWSADNTANSNGVQPGANEFVLQTLDGSTNPTASGGQIRFNDADFASQLGSAGAANLGAGFVYTLVTPGDGSGGVAPQAAYWHGNELVCGATVDMNQVSPDDQTANIFQDVRVGEVTTPVGLLQNQCGLTPVPEPSTFALLGSGLLFFFFSARRRKN